MLQHWFSETSDIDFDKNQSQARVGTSRTCFELDMKENSNCITISLATLRAIVSWLFKQIWEHVYLWDSLDFT